MSLIESDKTSRNRLRLLVLAFGLMFALMPLLGQAQDGVVPSEPEAVEASSGTAMPSLWDLAVQGGLFMIPRSRSKMRSLANRLTWRGTFDRSTSWRRSLRCLVLSGPCRG